MIMGSEYKYNIGDKIKTSGPRGKIIDGTLPGVIMRITTFEEWISQEPKPNMILGDVNYYKQQYYYEVSVD